MFYWCRSVITIALIFAIAHIIRRSKYNLLCACLQNGTMGLAGVDVRLGQDGRLRIIVPAQIAGEPQQVIRMKICGKNIEMVQQAQELTVIVNLDLNQCDEWHLGGEGNGCGLLVGTPQPHEPRAQSPRQ